MRQSRKCWLGLCAAACFAAGPVLAVSAQEHTQDVSEAAENPGAVTGENGAENAGGVSEAAGQENAETVETVAVRYTEGSYVVERDIPAGEYAVFANLRDDGNPYRTCSFTLYQNDTDEKRIGTFSFEHHGLVSLYNGQHLVLNSGYAVAASEAGLSLAPWGMYLAGRDMEPGKYLITPLTADGGYYALYNDVRYYYDYQDDYRRFFQPAVITVEEGQYLELGNAASVTKIAD